MANQVVMTFTADTAGATSGFERVGDSSKKMSEQVDKASDGFARAGDTADGAEGKARGLADTLGGATNVAVGLGAAVKGDLVGGLEQAASGVADLAGGFSQFLLPMLEKTRIGTLAKAAADRVAAAGSKVMAAGTWLMNTALLASPITWIVLGIIALIAIIVLLVRNVKFFGDIWRTVWTTVKAWALATWEWLKTLPAKIRDAFVQVTRWIYQPYYDAFQLIKTAWSKAWAWIKDSIGKAWEHLKALPGQLVNSFGKITDIIMGPFKAGFNGIAKLWNDGPGSWSFTFPGWVPGVGSKTFDVPDMPTLHAGGVVPGMPGQAVPVLALAGERVTAPGGAGGGPVLLGSDGSRLGDALIDLIADSMRARGGEPAALGLRLV